jgi:SH3-like domain-containing protein
MNSRIFRLFVTRYAWTGALIAALALGATAAALAQDDATRFVSLRSNEINVRAGPGTRYPIAWVFVRQGLPVEIVGEFDNWRKIRDMGGAEGWIHQNLLSRYRTAIVIGGSRTFLRNPKVGAVPVAVAEAGVIAQVLQCRNAWCRLQAGGHTGWLPRIYVWGVYPDEEIN